MASVELLNLLPVGRAESGELEPMMMKSNLSVAHGVVAVARRRGSTLVIVLAMLGLLSFMGTVFYLFAVQERSAAAYFSAAAKAHEVDRSDAFPWALQQLIIGAQIDPQPSGVSQKFSILAHPTENNRHSMIGNLVGPDVTPYTGLGVRVVYDDDGTGRPIVDANYDLTPDGSSVGDVDNLLNFVDSVAAWSAPPVGTDPDSVDETTLANARDYSGVDAMPHPDVDYTAPDINNLFLGYKGWAIRDNGMAATPRFERVQVIIPSFFRPQYLKSSTVNGSTGQDVPTDFDWYEPVAHPEYQRRSFRPHPNHVHLDRDGNPVFRFLEASRDAGIVATLGAGAFPFRPSEGDNTADFGKLGVWTGDATEDPTGFELDSDNDGDGIKEGIWLDLQYPIQLTTDGTYYATLHSFTIYDLDALLDLNAVGNVAQLPRDVKIDGSIVGPAGLGSVPLSDSNQGLGPNEINPIYALLPDAPETTPGSPFEDWYGANPSNILEQANMEWIWLLTGRMDNDGLDWTDIFPGRWGDANALYYHKTTTDPTKQFTVATLPRPGRAGDVTSSTTGTPSFGGVEGFDDNLDSLEGIAALPPLRGFVHPMDFAGTGLNRLADFRLPALLPQVSGGPAAWLAYSGYSAVGTVTATLNDSAYMKGPDQAFDGATRVDDLSFEHFFDALFEDPLEMIIDLDFTIRPDDEMFSIQDMLIGHLTDADATSAQGTVSDRLRQLLPSTYAPGSDRSDRFTTLTHSYRQVPFQQQLTGPRAWEWTADADTDTVPEFPPRFGTIPEYHPSDPFRPEVRDWLTIEAGEQNEILGQLSLSVNHILDPGGFRQLTEHPDDTAAASVNAMPVTPTFPPGTAAEFEYWARRDRQKLARDIYVLLYTLGGAEVELIAPPNTIKDYTGDNSNRQLYTEERLRQMAQFAVNMVDAMDTDNVVTRFEYDKNLGNGWGLDDQPWNIAVDPAATDITTAADVTGNGLYPEDMGDRGVVYGVEAQQLAFSEVLGVRSEEFPATMSDSAATEYDDTNGDVGQDNDGDRYFLHVELQNMLPMPLNLASSATPAAPVMAPVAPTLKDQAVWRLSRFDRRTGGPSDAQAPIPDRTVTLMAGNGVVPGGDRFTIAMAAQLNAGFTSAAATDPTAFGSADLYVDPTELGMNYNLISPDVAYGPVMTGVTPQPAQCNLDLIDVNDSTRWILSDGGTDEIANTDPGQFLELLNDPAHTHVGNDDFNISAGNGFDLVLQRRMNPNLPLLSTTENPWVDIDRIQVEFFDLFDTTSGPSAIVKVDQITSSERREPLDALTADVGGKEPTPLDERYNSIGNINDINKTFPGGTVSPFQLWQAHFDRDYASSGELLNLPIVGPKLLTRGLD
ncbi:MAG: hypothetical protein ABGZ17_15300, partial [Planctomycetaceae bacterium]